MARLSGLLILLTALSLLVYGESASASNPHPHRGKVQPFKAGDPKVKLNAKAESLLASGKPYQTQIKNGNKGRGLVVQDINAPSDVVWGRILDLDNYSKFVPRTTISENYKVKGSNPQIIHTRMALSVVVTKMEFFIRHQYYPGKNSLIWTLDYDRNSDIDDSCGFWYVVPHPSNLSASRVFYSVEVSMFDWVPGIVMDILSKKALTEATGWVKKESEKKARAMGLEVGGGDTKQDKKKKDKKKKDKKKGKGKKKVDDEDSPPPPPPGPDDATLARRWFGVFAILGLVALNIFLFFENMSGGKKKD
mmetsp:Transcript_19116/g.35503  ORF Transcript_19116/g.35503 Transcript_19116/m.35503 type:complete len:306 (+) Transcript_19116:62-979(+)